MGAHLSVLPVCRGFKTRNSLRQHVEKGVCLSHYKYPGGVYQRQKNVWEQLQQEGIDYSTACNPGDGPVPLVNQYACWDIETRPGPVNRATSETVFMLNRHEALSAAVCSTLDPDDDPVFFYCPDDPADVFELLYDHLKTLQERAEHIWHQRMYQVYLQLEEKIARLGGYVITTEDRYEDHSPEMQEMLQVNSQIKLTEEQRDELYADSVQLNVPDMCKYPRQQRRTPHPDVSLEESVGGHDPSRDILVYPGDLAGLRKVFDESLILQACSTSMDQHDEGEEEDQEGDIDDPTHNMYLARLLDESGFTDEEEEEEGEDDEDDMVDTKEEPRRKKSCFIADEADVAEELEYMEQEVAPGVTPVVDDAAVPAASEQQQGGGVSKKRRLRSPREKQVRKLKWLLHTCKSMGACLPAVGYNSGSFDLGVMGKVWPKLCGFVDCENPIFCEKERSMLIQPTTYDEDKDDFVCDRTRHPYLFVRNEGVVVPHIMAKGNAYKFILTQDNVDFLDLINYVPAHTSLDSLAKSYKLPECKGVFPYKVLAQPNLHTVTLPFSDARYRLFEDVL